MRSEVIERERAQFHAEPVKVTHVGADRVDIEGESGWASGVAEQLDVAVGETLVSYSQSPGWGGRLRGLARQDGTLLYWITEQEMKLDGVRATAEQRVREVTQFIESVEEMDAAYEALPPLFRLRIDKFREAGGIEWRLQHEGYEMASTGDAAKLSMWAADRDLFDGFDWEAADAGSKSWGLLDVPEAVRVDLGMSDGHSGNTWGFMVLLARHAVGLTPWAVVLEHGALTPLTGCPRYSCEHPVRRSIRKRLYELEPGSESTLVALEEYENKLKVLDEQVEMYRQSTAKTLGIDLSMVDDD